MCKLLIYMNTERYIERKSLIYETTVEYAKWAINHVLGCIHSCSYCYAFKNARRFGQVKDRDCWKTFKIVINALDILNKELPRLKDKIGEDFIHLCFSTDPFMYNRVMNTLFTEVEILSLHIIKLINDHGLKAATLTKGYYPKGIIDFQLSEENSYGISLSSLDNQFRVKHEYNSAPYSIRLDSLKMLHLYGLKTWVSIEPYPTPNIVEQDLEKLLAEVAFVDRIVFGRMNYVPAVNEYPKFQEFYNSCALKVAEFCEDSGIEYYVKKGTVVLEKETDFKHYTTKYSYTVGKLDYV